jgi:phosphatidylglycerol:prolipoprotein diacylglycerol transferase
VCSSDLKRIEKSSLGISKEQFSDLIFWGAIGVILGGRMGYALFYQFDRVLQEPLWMFQIWQGGMSFHGGLLGVLVVLAWFAWRQNKNMIDIMDFAGPLLPIGLGAGRIANFINQELWGRPTDVSWGIVFPDDALGLSRHPSQLYEALLEGLLLFVILWLYSRSPRARGAISGLGIFCYGSFRFFVEFFREPDSHLGYVALDWMTQGQILSLPMIILGGGLFAWALTQKVVQPVVQTKQKPASKTKKKSKKR